MSESTAKTVATSEAQEPSEKQYHLRKLETWEANQRWWDLLKPCILGSLPETVPLDETYLSNILQALSVGRLVAWLFFSEENGEFSIKCLMTTVLLKDTIAGTNLLRVYTVYGVSAIGDAAWSDLIEGLRDYATQNHCTAIIAETSNPRIVEVISKHGGNADSRLVFLPVKEA